MLVPQEITIVPALTVAENVTLGSEPSRWGWIQEASADGRARRALAALEIEVPLDALVGTVAPWQPRLVMIARAFDGKPSPVILDEPTAGLPPKEADLVTRAARRLVTGGVGVIYVSHHLSEVARISDEVTCIREGRTAVTFQVTASTRIRSSSSFTTPHRRPATGSRAWSETS